MAVVQSVLLLCLTSILSFQQVGADSLPDWAEEDTCAGDAVECALSLRQLRARKQSPGAGDDAQALEMPQLPDAVVGQEQNTSLEAQARVDTQEDPLDTSLGAKDVGGMILTGYHQTSPEIGAAIMREGFRPGHGGWCGGAIYFATTPQATFWKAIASTSHHGFIIEARVRVGRVKYAPKHCYGGMNGRRLRREGFDSIRFNPGDGDEIVIYDPHQVLSMKEIKVTPPGPNERPSYAIGR